VQYYAKSGLPLDVCIAQLTQWNRSICRPPLDDGEVARLTHFIYERVDQERAAEISERVSLRARGPAWPHDLFIGTRFGRWVEAIAGSRGTHPDLVAACGLGTLGAASTGGYRLHYLEPGIDLEDTHWIAPSALWIMPILETGMRKSAVFREILPTLDETNKTLALVARRYNAERDALEDELRALEKAARGRDAVDARREITQRIADLPAKLGERWILSEGTPEAFLRALGETSHIALLSEEGDETISRFFGHYSGVADMNGVLKSWDGGITIGARIGRGVTRTEGVASILALVQPTVLRKLTAVDAEDRGLLARFLFASPPPLRGDRPEISKAEVARACADFADTVRAIYYGGTAAASEALTRAGAYRPQYVDDPTAVQIEMPTPEQKRGRPKAEPSLPPAEKLLRPDLRSPIDIVFAGECIDLLKDLESRLRAKAVEGGEHYTARGWIRKAHEHAMRIAAALQICEVPPLDHERIDMDPHWVRRAISLVEHYFLPHYYVAKDLIDSPPLADLGLHILTHFSDRDSFTLGEAAQIVHKRTPDIRPVLLWLAHVGAIRTETIGKSLIAYPLPNVEY
jgi:hypothetical protein